MGDPEIVVYADLEELSRAAAEMFVATAMARVAETGACFAALSGGSTPRRLCELLATRRDADRTYWNSTHLFQVDERCVPPDHPESNFRMIREALLDPARVPQANFHRIAGESEDAGEAAHQYALELARVIPARERGFPRFDLVFLGVGEDGHTASLFPGSPPLAETQMWTIPSGPGGGGWPRVTLTLPVLNAAARVLFLVSGGKKAEILGKVLEGPHQPHLLPAQGIRPANGHLTWYLDRAAASRLQATLRGHG